MPLYSDLLLHDIGTGDGIVQGDALGEEIRTPALWGLRARRGLLHDGSAATPAEAILRHAEEGSESRRLYTELPAADSAALAVFSIPYKNNPRHKRRAVATIPPAR